MEQQEQSCFVERCRVPREQFRVVNVGRGDVPSPSHLADVHAVLIGGAGQYSAADDYEWTPAVLDFVRHVVTEGLPLFGSCWGHQIIARALGGRVVYDPEHSELGCGWVELTEAGKNDPLFHRFPDRFRANMGHHDRVVDLPAGATELARNDQRYQAFRLKGKPVYCTQFHSELDAERERERILVYKELYQDALPADGTVQEVLDSLADTTAVDDLLYDFLTTFVVRGLPDQDAVQLQARSYDGAPHVPENPSLSSRRIPDA
jgi:GMP synthase (glutamine-hydrolysing)